MIKKVKALLKRLEQAIFGSECYKESLGYNCKHKPGECGGPR